MLQSASVQLKKCDLDLFLDFSVIRVKSDSISYLRMFAPFIEWLSVAYYGILIATKQGNGGMALSSVSTVMTKELLASYTHLKYFVYS